MLWILLWSSLPLVVQTVLPAVIGAQVSTADILRGAGAAYGSLIALWGVAKLRRDVAAIQAVLADLTGGALTVERLFRAMSSISMPLLLMAGSAALYGLGHVLQLEQPI